jgi:hypothetical protein
LCALAKQSFADQSTGEAVRRTFGNSKPFGKITDANFNVITIKSTKQSNRCRY